MSGSCHEQFEITLSPLSTLLDPQKQPHAYFIITWGQDLTCRGAAWLPKTPSLVLCWGPALLSWLRVVPQGYSVSVPSAPQGWKSTAGRVQLWTLSAGERESRQCGFLNTTTHGSGRGSPERLSTVLCTRTAIAMVTEALKPCEILVTLSTTIGPRQHSFLQTLLQSYTIT